MAIKVVTYSPVLVVRDVLDLGFNDACPGLPAPPHPLHHGLALGVDVDDHVDVQTQHTLHVQQVLVEAAGLVPPVVPSYVQHGRHHREVVQTCNIETVTITMMLTDLPSYVQHGRHHCEGVQICNVETMMTTMTMNDT